MKVKDQFKSRGEAAQYLNARGWIEYTTEAGIKFRHLILPGERRIVREKPGKWGIEA